jgi:hypothetical protein
MVKNFKCPNKIGSSAKIDGYFAKLKSTVIDKQKLRLRLDKFIVTHFRAIRGSMKIAKSVTKKKKKNFKQWISSKMMRSRLMTINLFGKQK